MTIELKKLCINNFFFIEGTKLYCPPSPSTYNKFVQGQNFWKIFALSEFESNSGHFFVKLHKFVDFPDFSPKNRPAQGDYKLEVLTQHIFVVGGVG